jgi:hypothetical protein
LLWPRILRQLYPLNLLWLILTTSLMSNFGILVTMYLRLTLLRSLISTSTSYQTTFISRQDSWLGGVLLVQRISKRKNASVMANIVLPTTTSQQTCLSRAETS